MRYDADHSAPTSGKHIILEMWDASNTNSPEVIRAAIIDACDQASLRLLRVFIHQFEPFGISGVAMIAESHITIHTWPEYSFVAVDIYSSRKDVDIDSMAHAMKAAFSPGQVNQVEIQRGKQRERDPARQGARRAIGPS
jgi:S-adenosylmethionine decarboxylase proenzyme